MTDKTDKFGNPLVAGEPYARGDLLPDTASDLAKLRCAWSHIRRRRDAGGADAIYLASGLERTLRLPEDLDEDILDDEVAAALYSDEVAALGIAHLGGDPGRHDVMVVNRTTAGLLLAADVVVHSGQPVIGVSAGYSHPAVIRAVAHGGGRFHDCCGLEEFRAAVEISGPPEVVFLTRLAVTYDILPEAEIHDIVTLANACGARVILDDAGGGRVGPACFGQPRSLELGVDIAVTGLDKYGTIGPRLGLLGGDAEIVAAIRARAYEMGLEARQFMLPAVARSLRQYSPEQVRNRVAVTMDVADALETRLSCDTVRRTEVIAYLPGEEILTTAMARAGINDAPVVPYEATAAFSMLLLKDYGLVTVHFAGIPPGTADLLVKFLPPDTIRRFGGAEAVAEAFDKSFERLAGILDNRWALRALLFGQGS